MKHRNVKSSGMFQSGVKSKVSEMKLTTMIDTLVFLDIDPLVRAMPPFVLDLAE